MMSSNFLDLFWTGYVYFLNGPQATPYTLTLFDNRTLTIRDHSFPLDDLYCFVNGWYSLDRAAIEETVPGYFNISFNDFARESDADELLLETLAREGGGFISEDVVKGMRLHAATKCLFRGGGRGAVCDLANCGVVTAAYLSDTLASIACARRLDERRLNETADETAGDDDAADAADDGDDAADGDAGDDGDSDTATSTVTSQQCSWGNPSIEDGDGPRDTKAGSSNVDIRHLFGVREMAGGKTDPQAEEWKAQGNEKLKAGQAQEALVLYEKALARLPSKAWDRRRLEVMVAASTGPADSRLQQILRKRLLCSEGAESNHCYTKEAAQGSADAIAEPAHTPDEAVGRRFSLDASDTPPLSPQPSPKTLKQSAPDLPPICAMAVETKPWLSQAASMGYGSSVDSKIFAEQFQEFLLSVEDRPATLERVVERRRQNLAKQQSIDLGKLFRAHPERATEELQSSKSCQFLCSKPTGPARLHTCERQRVTL
eukprot:g22307.t1